MEGGGGREDVGSAWRERIAREIREMKKERGLVKGKNKKKTMEEGRRKR